MKKTIKQMIITDTILTGMVTAIMFAIRSIILSNVEPKGTYYGIEGMAEFLYKIKCYDMISDISLMVVFTGVILCLLLFVVIDYETIKEDYYSEGEAN